MLKFTRKLEYALIAIKYIAGNENSSARDIAENFNIPYELLAKTLQQLVKSGVLISIKGVNGGYSLAKKADDISIINIIEGLNEDYRITNCQIHSFDHQECGVSKHCNIKGPINKIQQKIDDLLINTTLKQIIE